MLQQHLVLNLILYLKHNLQLLVFAIDVTWDDPVGDVDEIRYDYFLMGSKQITKDHLPSEAYDYPELAGDGRDKVCYKL